MRCLSELAGTGSGFSSARSTSQSSRLRQNEPDCSERKRRNLIEGRLGDAEVETPDQAYEQHARILSGEVE